MNREPDIQSQNASQERFGRPLAERPTFNLKVAVRETGVKPDTLRAWERRYGIPQPQRTSGGHRLYSERDIDCLKWLVARQEEGLSISRAVELWRELEREGRDPLRAYQDSRSTDLIPKPTSPPMSYAAEAGDTIADLRQTWVEACVSFDEQASERTLNQAFALYSPEMVCLELLQKGLQRVGAGWYEGTVTAQQEHFASALAMRRLETLLVATPAPTRPGRILVGCPPEEEHVFGPLLLTLILRRRGWDVVYLGADLPIAEITGTVSKTRPNVVVLVAQRLQTAAHLRDMANTLHDATTLVAFGGRIFNLIPELQQRVPGHFLGERLESAAQVVEQILVYPPPPPLIVAHSSEILQAHQHFQEKRTRIEASVWQDLAEGEIAHSVLANANENLGDGIVAALALGDIAYLNTDIEWIEGLLANYDLPESRLSHYLEIYWNAATTHLDERGRPIVDWLAGLNL